MNYLAHLFLSKQDKDSLTGNFIADHIKGKKMFDFPNMIIEGIKFHRKIDVFVDEHPLVKEGKQIISDERRKVSGIMLDLFYDHFLAKNWLEFSEIPLERYTQELYGKLGNNRKFFNEKINQIFQSMSTRNWLYRYQKIETIKLALNNMSKRSVYLSKLGDSGDELENNYDKLKENFYQVFDDVVIYSNNLKEVRNENYK